MFGSTATSLLLICIFMSSYVFSQEPYPVKLSANQWHNKEQELRYKPDGSDFVIVNGKRLFTRAIYGTNTAFRVEAGDRPEFALYMPGMGGNFKFGIGNGQQSKWLTQANTITARYRPGAMLYTVEDSLLGKGKMFLEILALADGEGFVIQTKLENTAAPIDLYWAFGGATGKKFSRDGDMGPDPESSFYLKPENCKDNRFVLAKKNSFQLTYGSGLQVGPDGRYFVEDLNQPAKPAKELELTGVFAEAATLKLGDAKQLASPSLLFQSTAAMAPVVIGKMTINKGSEHYFSIYNPHSKKPITYNELSVVFQQAQKARETIANRIMVTTPDPYINTIGGTLSIASNAIWDNPSYMHGAVGWRMRLNGWRGPYTADPLGWHDRAKTHFNAYALSQFTSPATGPIVPDSAMHFARSWEKNNIGMFSSGYISRLPNAEAMKPHHYDMNLIYIDGLLRHFDWTGDTAFIRKTWPVIKRHLDWETRNFDADKNHLYDAFAAIWASDALQYSGGDVAHTSAYNYFHFKKAATLAALMKEDPAPYLLQAEKIKEAMNRVLWLRKKGTYAEFKDLLGNKLVHDAAALWTIYHSVDSEVPDKFQAYQMMRYVDLHLPHIPLRPKGIDDGGYYTLSTTNWMPYVWSLNNVVLAESIHTSLANWQANRPDEAFKLFKSEVLQSMYMGGSPGNFVLISAHDAARGESYRDFADPVGIFSRALVEGLFGIVPDALGKKILVRPGLPAAWEYASFSTPDISFDFKRTGSTDVYKLDTRFSGPMHLNFQAIARGQVEALMVNGKKIQWKNVSDAVGLPVIETTVPSAEKYEIRIVWKGAQPVLPSTEAAYKHGQLLNKSFTTASVLKVFDPQTALKGTRTSANGFSATVNATVGKYTVFVQLKQGELIWWMPLCFSVAQPVEWIAENTNEDNNNRFRLQNNTNVNAFAKVYVNGYSTTVQTVSGKISEPFTIPLDALNPGTNKLTIAYADGKKINSQLVNWKGEKQVTLEMIDLGAFFNDKVTQIFKNKYLSPRPAVTTLQLPWQGIGDWPHPHEHFEVNDSGLRRLAGDKNEIVLPKGIRFNTPGEKNKNNILFTSQWDNYPKTATIPLSGKASHVYFLMAGSTNPMQSQLTNGEIVVEYADGTADRLALRNPENWWPIDQDYFTDGFAFALQQPRPMRVHLKTGKVILGEESKAKYNGKKIDGGAATVLDMLIDPSKELKSLTLKTIANDVVIGLMGISLHRD
jgi:hypothetical protein